MTNGTLINITAKFIAIGTSQINLWTDGLPFIVTMNTEEDFDVNGFDYNDYADMSVGEVREDNDYEGIMVVRMA